MVVKKRRVKRVGRRSVSKSGKKVVKKNRRKRVGRNLSRSASKARKDFEIYAHGVERLGELRRELNSLDARGFSKEEQRIKRMLKNVSDIPKIESEIKALGILIDGKYKPKKKRKFVGVKDLKGDIEDIKEEVPKIRRGLSVARSLKGDVEDIKTEVPKIHRRLKDLSDDINDISKIKGGLKKLGEKIDIIGKKKAIRGKVDSGVGLLVDTNFNDFFGSLKIGLSDRIRKREIEIDEILERDLKKRDYKFRKKYDSLLEEFKQKGIRLEEDYEKRYQKKVKSSLGKEVHDKFRKLLNEKLSREKVVLGREYKAKLKEQADRILDKKREILEGEMRDSFEMELNKLHEKLKNEHDKMERQEKKEREVLRKKREKLFENIRNEKRRVENLLKEERDKIREEEQKEREVLRKKREKLTESIRSEKKREENFTKSEKEREENLARGQKIKEEVLVKDKALLVKAKGEFEERRIKFWRDAKHSIESQEEDLKVKLKKRFEDELHRELDRKEKLMNAKFRNEYDLRLNAKLRENFEELRRKKIDLELDLQKKMKEALG
jgi:hypothetical protein